MDCLNLTWDVIEKLSWIFSIITGVGAILLTIYLSRQETKVANFSELLRDTRTTVNLLTQQNAEALRIKNIERKGNLNRLRQTWTSLMDKSFPGGKQQFDQASIDVIRKWIEYTMPFLESELHNPILLENEEALGKWHSLYQAAKIDARLLAATTSNYIISSDSGDRQATPEELEKMKRDTADGFFNQYLNLFTYLFENVFRS